jgi:hypothetical protein
VEYSVEKTGPHKLSLKANDNDIGNRGVNVSPSGADGTHSIAFGPGISEATVGMLNILYP